MGNAATQSDRTQRNRGSLQPVASFFRAPGPRRLIERHPNQRPVTRVWLDRAFDRTAGAISNAPFQKPILLILGDVKRPPFFWGGK